MVSNSNQMNGNQVGQNQAHLVNELMGRFSSKADFVKYFKEQLQLYVPPDYM